MFDALAVVAATSLRGAVMVLLIFTGFGMIVGGPKGARWVLTTAFAPVRNLLKRKITGVLYICGYVVVGYLVGALAHHQGP